MCIIAILSHDHPDTSLVVAANRDELYRRPWSRPQVLSDAPRIVAPRDLERGGTWMGATADGLFVGLTNQRTHATPDSTLASRGQVVLEALQRGSVGEVHRYLEGLDARGYNSFNLVYGDADRIEVAYARTAKPMVEIAVVPRGLSVLTNDRLDATGSPKIGRATALFGSAARGPWPELAAVLQTALADHELPLLEQIPEPPVGSVFPKILLRELEAVCIHTAAYGTRSSTILGIAPGRVARYLFAPGPPCTTAFEDVTHLLTTNSAA